MSSAVEHVLVNKSQQVGACTFFCASSGARICTARCCLAGVHCMCAMLVHAIDCQFVVKERWSVQPSLNWSVNTKKRTHECCCMQSMLQLKVLPTLSSDRLIRMLLFLPVDSAMRYLQLSCFGQVQSIELDTLT